MRKIYLFALALLALTSCKPIPEQVAKQFILDRAVDPASMQILSHSEVLRPERTQMDTFYHISAFGDGLAYSDSIRIETHTYPEHYYCCLTIEGNDSTGNPCRCNVELAVMSDGEVMFYWKYRDTYYDATDVDTRAQRDTLTGLRTPSFYNECGVWALKQMLINPDSTNDSVTNR